MENENDTESKQVTVRLPIAVWERLSFLSIKRRTSLNAEINSACAEYLAEAEAA